MGKAVDIVKRSGKKTEAFDRDKLHASVAAACLSVRSPEGEADLTAHRVCDIVLVWLDTRSEVTSADLRRIATKALHDYHPEAAYFYSQHKHII